MNFIKRNMKILLLMTFFLGALVFVGDKKLHYKLLQLNILRYIVFVGRHL